MSNIKIKIKSVKSPFMSLDEVISSCKSGEVYEDQYDGTYIVIGGHDGEERQLLYLDEDCDIIADRAGSHRGDWNSSEFRKVPGAKVCISIS